MAEDENRNGSRFHRQLVLLDEIKKLQESCQHPILRFWTGSIYCDNCGSLWVK